MEWYQSWFNSPYYHMLYRERNEAEARLFIDNLLRELNPSKDQKLLDLACGKGRHSVYLNQLGYHTVGADLSESNIEYAKQFENERLRFVQHDMRAPIDEQFDFIFNLFTSFGYFENHEDHLKTLSEIQKGLHPQGTFVMDFLNAHVTLEKLVPEETKVVDDVTFNINRRVEGHAIIKRINFEKAGQPFEFEEKVNAFSRNQLIEMIESSGMHVLQEFGDYQLNPFNLPQSPRLILLAVKS